MPKKKLIDDDKVLEQALLVISEKGPEAFTLQDIAKVVGLAPATLLQRFGTKQKLLIKACRHASTKVTKDAVKLRSKKLSWEDGLVKLLCALPDKFGTRQDIANSLGLLKLDMIDPELHPIARNLFQGLRQAIYECLKAAKLGSQHDIDKLTWELDALRHGLIIQWTLSGTGTLKNWLKRGIENYLKRM